MSTPTVFISYSHLDEDWLKKLVPHLHALEQAGVGLRVWHDRKIDGGDKWYPEIVEAMEGAAVGILLISANFLSSPFCIQEEVPALLKHQEERRMLLIPVLVKQCPWKAHRWLKDRQMVPRDGKSVAIDFPGDLADGVFAAVADQVLEHFDQLATDQIISQEVTDQAREFIATQGATPDPNVIPLALEIEWPTLADTSIDITRLPETGSALFGRNEELALLDNAWRSSESDSDPIRILAFTAHGGVGKSTLVNHWLVEMKRDNYRGAIRVFGWSFYSQGVRQEQSASADTFINAALRFFGDVDPTSGSPWDKGSRLARLIGNERALLVLDGMEPLQSAQPFERGKLRDPALESLLRGLSRYAKGMCLITTRESLPDLSIREGVVIRDLEQINVDAGRALLRTARVIGTDAELEMLANQFGPHALAISLLGVFLREQPGHGIGPAAALNELPGEKPIDRVLAGFERWLGESPEREALRLLGFFDRPADTGCLRALRSDPIIPDLTNHLAALDEAAWDRVLDRLVKLRLIHVSQAKDGEVVDAHPLIREHFAAMLKDKSAWKEGHRRLYEYLCANTKEGDEPTLEDLQPLYQAVAHGCQAGLQKDTLYKVYVSRTTRGTGIDGFYSTRKLGAFGSDLGAAVCFFETPWSRVSSALAETEQAWLLNQVAFRLRALGRLTDALEPMRANLKMRVKAEEWQHAPSSASTLSEIELTLGEVAEAVGDAEQSVTYADRSSDPIHRMINRTTLADALHQGGDRAKAEMYFREAEQIQQESEPNPPLLYSVQGFQYCDLLLAVCERAAWQILLNPQSAIRNPKLLDSCGAVSQRASQALQIVLNGSRNLLDIALNHLSLGRAALYSNILEAGDFRLLTSDLSHIDSAVAGLRRAGTQHFLPLGLLIRAWLRFLGGRDIGPESAQEDLDEAWEIAERGPMRLFMADIHLYRARLFHAVQPYPWGTDADGKLRRPKDDLVAARKLIEQCGYWRRKEELEDAEEAAKNW